MITKEKITGMLGATIFMLLLLVILLFSFFTVASPSQELEGIPVMFGNVEDARGYEEAPIRDISPPIEEIKAPKATQKEAPLISQTTEESISIEEQKNREKEREERSRQEEAERKRREEEAKKRIINKEMAGLFGENSNASRGSTEGEGTQGASTGNAAQGAPSGIGGIGTYALGGRSLGSGGLKQPKYTVDDYGTVVVNITVDPKGNVISAEIGKGTQAPSSALLNESLRAARNTKFNSISTANNQQGTITYNFNLN
ncbi:MAG: energy transducer TonB [Dysgonamonadaceae bacterium]|nr:energy transducer TonB [Dysgonamonadaceae bacterium]MDD4728566.1 energy transducer TonB [Dysgonamonadaceae bacterium]